MSAATLPATRAARYGRRKWAVQCPHCHSTHYHVGLGQLNAPCQMGQYIAYKRGQKPAASMKLSTVQRICLRDAAKHSDPYFSAKGKSEHGGRRQTVYSLQRAGLLTGSKLTALGREILDAPPPVTMVRRPAHSHYFDFVPPQLCKCGGTLAVQDHRSPNSPATASPESRYECFCEKCKTCDPNGWSSRALVIANSPAFFTE